ncbi:MAG: hypothetical protein KUG54_00395, partial [Gammaproteobacteria bacterium]|nr:hypothetical protein [Gammaproteobacteria bacterium]
QEWHRALEGPDSNIFITVLKTVGALAVVAPELDGLFELPCQADYLSGPDNLGQVAEQVLHHACNLTDKGEIRFAALLTLLDNPTANLPLNSQQPSLLPKPVQPIQPIKLEQLCKRLSVPNSWHDLARLMAIYFQRVNALDNADGQELLALLESLDAFRREQRFELFLIACRAVANGYCDTLSDHYPPADWLKQALIRTKPIAVQPLLQQGLKGLAIQQGLRKLRLQALQPR